MKRVKHIVGNVHTHGGGVRGMESPHSLCLCVTPQPAEEFVGEEHTHTLTHSLCAWCRVVFPFHPLQAG